MTAEDWAIRLASGAPIDEPAALVVAHPDDETAWAGAALSRLRDLKLILVTDGAPEDMADARRHGFATRERYAEARRGELKRALQALGAQPRLIEYRVADQAAILQLSAVTARLATDLAGSALVLTHPYEGGHPDHDACALAVAGAARSAVVEFACYASVGGERVFGRFVADPARRERSRTFATEERERVATALAAHASQADVFGGWRPEAERWRAAPRYDFAAPPPGKAVLYDGFGWAMTGARWRALAAGAPACA